MVIPLPPMMEDVAAVFGVGSARWPDDPPQSGVAHGFRLIPVSDDGVVDEVKKGKTVARTINKVMTKNEMTFPDT